MDSIITFEERWASDGRQRRERPFSTMPVYRIAECCGICGSVTYQHTAQCTYDQRKGMLPQERIIRSYPRHS